MGENTVRLQRYRNYTIWFPRYRSFPAVYLKNISLTSETSQNFERKKSQENLDSGISLSILVSGGSPVASLGLNPRNLGLNPRNLGLNPRNLKLNPRSLGLKFKKSLTESKKPGIKSKKPGIESKKPGD